MSQKPIKPFKDYTLQWHLLNRCQMNCRHCYIRNRKQEMSLDQFFQGLNNYSNFLDHHKIKGRIYFTGGDPLLHDSFKEIIQMTVARGISFGVMGNYHCLSEDMMLFLKENSIRFYQLSLDGLKENNEITRGKGTFNKVLDAIELLETAGITTVVNMTVTEENIADVVPLIDLLSNTKLSRFDLTRIVPIGSAKDQKIISPVKYRELLLSILQVEEKIKQKNQKFKIGKKDHLWKLLYDEHDKLRIDLNDMYHGCGMVIRHLTILPNGEIYPCRKLEISLGNILKQPLTEIYEQNEFVRKVRSNDLIKGCATCRLKNVCRGCPSVTYGYHNNFNDKDPQCWIQ